LEEIQLCHTDKLEEAGLELTNQTNMAEELDQMQTRLKREVEKASTDRSFSKKELKKLMGQTDNLRS